MNDVYINILNKYINKYNIVVKKYYKTLNATFDSDFESVINIPYPDTKYKLLVALHEVGHIVKKQSKHSYLTEYDAEMFAIHECKLHDIICDEYESDAKHYVFKHLIYEINNNLIEYEEIDINILKWLSININDIKNKTIHYANIEFKN